MSYASASEESVFDQIVLVRAPISSLGIIVPMWWTGTVEEICHATLGSNLSMREGRKFGC